VKRQIDAPRHLLPACAALLAIAIAFSRAIPARAHAALAAADPAAGSVLADPPAAVVLDFTEALDVGASSVELHESGAGLVVEGPGIVDPALPARLTLDLPPLPDGTYSAVWRARSAVDGHITDGVVTFSVGADALPPRILPPPGTPEPATAWPAPLDALARWLNFLAAAVAVGSLLFGWLVWRPACRHMQPAAAEDDYAATALLRTLALIGGGVWAAATLLFIAVQGRLLAPDAFLDGALAILSGRTGLLVVARFGLLLALALLVPRLPAAGSGPLRPWLLLSLVGAVALLTISLQSHAAALPDGQAFLGIALDWLHLLAMSAWLGGLLPLALLLRPGVSRPGRPAALIPAFSRVALPAVAVLAITGFFSARLVVRTTEALVATTHGRGLGLKLALFAVLLGLGAVNLFLITPLLRRDEGTAARRLGRTVRTEMAVGVVLLLIVGGMTAVAPAFDALAAQHRLGFEESTRQDDVRMTLRVAPLRIGDNEFAIDVRDDREGASRVTPEVLLRFSSPGEEASLFQVEAPAVGNGRFLARGAYLSAPGDWQIEVILRLSGFDDVRHTFDLLVDAEDHGHNSDS
jgi:copper transport protein